MNFLLMGHTFNPISHCKAHMHDSLEIVIYTEGAGITTLDKKSYRFEKGTVAIIPSNVVHSEVSDETFSDIYVQVNDVGSLFSTPMVFQNMGDDIVDLAKMLFKVYIKDEEKSTGLINSLFNTILEIIKIKNVSTVKYSFVNTIKDSIAVNFSNAQYDLVKVIRSLGFNGDYVRRCFKHDTGLTPNEFLTEIRIKHAKDLLERVPYRSIKEVAFSCGFNDPYYFSRCFKKQTGLFPKQYREKFVNNNQ